MPDRTRRNPVTGGARLVACLGLGLMLSGCASWHTTDQSPSQLFSESRPGKVRITNAEGEQTVLARPRVLGNVLAGFDNQCLERFGNDTNDCQEMGVPIFEISTLEVERRGAASIYLPAVGGLLAAWLLANR